jgi:hypothetical protein
MPQTGVFRDRWWRQAIRAIQTGRVKINGKDTGGPTTAYRDATSRLRLAGLGFKDATLRFRLQATGYKDAGLRARISVRGYKDAGLSLPAQGHGL